MTIYKLSSATLMLCLMQTTAFADQCIGAGGREYLKDQCVRKHYPVKLFKQQKPHPQECRQTREPEPTWQLVALTDAEVQPDSYWQLITLTGTEVSDGLVDTEPPASIPRAVIDIEQNDDKISLKSTIDYQHYTISPPSAEEIASTINQTPPNGHHGHSKWLIEWNFEPRELGNDRCEVDTANINLTTTISMPKLDYASQQDSLINAKFNCYYDSLMKYEMAHHGHALKAARKISDVLSYHGESQCSDLYDELKAKWDVIHQQANNDHMDYDRATDFGRSGCAIVF